MQECEELEVWCAWEVGDAGYMHAEFAGDEYMHSGEPGGVWLMTSEVV